MSAFIINSLRLVSHNDASNSSDDVECDAASLAESRQFDATPNKYTRSHPRFIYLTFILNLTISFSTLTATIYFPLIPLLLELSSVPLQSINLTVATCAIAKALVLALIACLADPYGRRPALLGLVILYLRANTGMVGLMHFPASRSSYVGLLIIRILQSINASPTLAAAYNIEADVALVSKRGTMLSLMLSFCKGLSAF